MAPRAVAIRCALPSVPPQKSALGGGCLENMARVGRGVPEAVRAPRAAPRHGRAAYSPQMTYYVCAGEVALRVLEVPLDFMARVGCICQSWIAVRRQPGVRLFDVCSHSRPDFKAARVIQTHKRQAAFDLLPLWRCLPPQTAEARSFSKPQAVVGQDTCLGSESGAAEHQHGG